MTYFEAQAEALQIAVKVQEQLAEMGLWVRTSLLVFEDGQLATDLVIMDDVHANSDDADAGIYCSVYLSNHYANNGSRLQQWKDFLTDNLGIEL